MTSERDKDVELAELRGRVAEHELAYRQAQERINDYQRDWLYTSACNFRGTIARLRSLKSKLLHKAKVGLKLTLFAIGILLAPLRAVLRMVGIGRRTPVESDPSQCTLKVGFQEKLPETLVVGKGNSTVVAGWAFHPTRRITHLELRLLIATPAASRGEVIDADADLIDRVDERGVTFVDRIVPVIIRNVPNRQVLTDYHPHADRDGNSFWSGFFAELTLPAIPRPAKAQLVVKAYLDDATIETVPLGQLSLTPQMPYEEGDEQLPAGPGPLVAVCMTTYNPPVEIFRRQIDSIRNQTHRRWICYIRDDGSNAAGLAGIRSVLGDDPRFVFRINEKNLGFYKNFERVMADVPADADFVALSDQDDYWHADKLKALIDHFTPDTTLVYSDMNITDETGRVKATTYWTTRDTNHEHFPTLLLANTVTGAASMMRRTLLDYVLPFPEKVGDAYHDHWLGVAAMSLGKIGYVDRPLYDYVQHSRNVVGHVAPKPPTWAGAFYRFFGFFHPMKIRRNVNAFLRHGRGFYTADLLRIQHTARNALVRCGAEAAEDKRAALTQVISMADSWRGWLWLALRPFRRRDSWRRTVGVERNLLQSLCWRTHLKVKAWWGTRLTSRGIIRGAIAAQSLPKPRVIDHVDTIAAIERITAPLTLSIHPDSPRRVNIVVSIIDFKYVFGGYITVFHLARCLSERGFRVRLIVTDECDFRPVGWSQNFRSYPGLEDFLDRIELVYAHDRRTVVHVSPHDTFLPTSWWTAHIAHAATKALGKDRFVYLVQEYEPGFYPFGALAAISQESYSFPHYALFSTEILREYFRLHRHGVFATGEGDRLSESFENTITAVGKITPADLKRRGPRKLLFYCRPEPHAMRNMFDVGLMALRQAVASGAFAGWEFHGIGTLAMQGKLQLAEGVYMTLLPRHDQEQYRKILKNYDVGLSLMCSPHPSLVPLEMCSAGMLTVTNTFANKTPEKLLRISENFVPVEGTVAGVTEGLKLAESQLGDVERRVRGADVRWATKWEQSFHPGLMHRLEQFLHAAMANRDVDAMEARRAA